MDPELCPVCGRNPAGHDECPESKEERLHSVEWSEPIMCPCCDVCRNKCAEDADMDDESSCNRIAETGSTVDPMLVDVSLQDSFLELVAWWDAYISSDTEMEKPMTISDVYGEETADMVERARAVRRRLEGE